MKIAQSPSTVHHRRQINIQFLQDSSLFTANAIGTAQERTANPPTEIRSKNSVAYQAHSGALGPPGQFSH